MTQEELRAFAKEVAEPKMAALMAKTKCPDFLRCVETLRIEALDCRSIGIDYHVVATGFTCNAGKVYAGTICDIWFEENDMVAEMGWLRSSALLFEGTITVVHQLETATLQVKPYNITKYIGLFPELMYLADVPVISNHLEFLQEMAKRDEAADDSHLKTETMEGNNRSLIVNVEGGYFRADPCLDPDYPGIDVEFIADNEPSDICSSPRVLFEKPIGQPLSALIWSDPMDEDYSNEIEFLASSSKHCQAEPTTSTGGSEKDGDGHG